MSIDIKNVYVTAPKERTQVAAELKALERKRGAFINMDKIVRFEIDKFEQIYQLFFQA